MNDSDIRDTALYREAEALYKALRLPGSGQISDASEIHASPDGMHAVFAGVLLDALEGVPPTRICRTDLATGDTRVLTFGPNSDHLPRYSPDGGHIAFLSDRRESGNFQLYLLDPVNGAAQSTPPVEGWVEYLHWSPDGRRVLLGVAGHGADVASVQGATRTKPVTQDVHAWMPSVQAGDENCRWRSVWVYEVSTDRVRQIAVADANVWEAAWCGNDAFVAVVSAGPGEGLWYSARLQVIDLETNSCRELFAPRDQIGWPAASPSGSRVAIVEAVCSDRCFVAGDLRLLETQFGNVQRVDTRGVDVTYTEWRSDQTLLLAGHRGFETVVGLYDAASETFTELWASRHLTTTGVNATISGFGEAGDCVLVGESFVQAPEIAAIRGGEYLTIKSFGPNGAHHRGNEFSVERKTWQAPDGLEIQGWLLRPKGNGPYPLIMNVHGGPVWQTRPFWLGRRGAPFLMLLSRGFAIFFPNPRGSSGRGQEFARRVVADMGGADTQDCLSGLDHLVEEGSADPKRLGVMGLSYGGFMTSWLITQDSRFAAAVPVAPTTNHVTQQLISNIPHFVRMFVADTYADPGGQYFQRSPVMHAARVKTPTLNICGALDRCAPPEEAIQFHSALLEHGVKSVLINYPQEGHGVRSFPALIDYAARVVSWFQEHLGPDAVAKPSYRV